MTSCTKQLDQRAAFGAPIRRLNPRGHPPNPDLTRAESLLSSGRRILAQGAGNEALPISIAHFRDNFKTRYNLLLDTRPPASSWQHENQLVPIRRTTRRPRKLTAGSISTQPTESTKIELVIETARHLLRTCKKRTHGPLFQSASYASNTVKAESFASIALVKRAASPPLTTR
jgi:hypothetical protein